MFVALKGCKWEKHKSVLLHFRPAYYNRSNSEVAIIMKNSFKGTIGNDTVYSGRLMLNKGISPKYQYCSDVYIEADESDETEEFYITNSRSYIMKKQNKNIIICYFWSTWTHIWLKCHVALTIQPILNYPKQPPKTTYDNFSQNFLIQKWNYALCH